MSHCLADRYVGFLTADAGTEGMSAGKKGFSRHERAH